MNKLLINCISCQDNISVIEKENILPEDIIQYYNNVSCGENCIIDFRELSEDGTILNYKQKLPEIKIIETVVEEIIVKAEEPIKNPWWKLW